MATRVNADVLIPAVDYDADVITLDANPLDDRAVWGQADRVTGVWQRGVRAK